MVCGLLDLARERDAIALLLTTGGSVARQQDIDRMPEVNMSAFQDIYQANSIRTADYYDFVERHPSDVLKVNICHRSAEDRDGTLNWLRLNPIGSIGLTLARSSISSLECSSGNANKTTGLSEICSRIGISMAEVVYVGDAENDLEAMSASGCAVAMGNALPDVKGNATRDFDSGYVANKGNDGNNGGISGFLGSLGGSGIGGFGFLGLTPYTDKPSTN